FALYSVFLNLLAYLLLSRLTDYIDEKGCSSTISDQYIHILADLIICFREYHHPVGGVARLRLLRGARGCAFSQCFVAPTPIRLVSFEGQCVLFFNDLLKSTLFCVQRNVVGEFFGG